MMPKGIKVITTLNIILISIFVGNLLYLHKAAQDAPVLVFVNLISASALVLITLIVLLRLARLVAFARVLAYAMILVLGLQLLWSLKTLMSGHSALVVSIDLIVIFYVIGMRGYLASEMASAYFQRKSA